MDIKKEKFMGEKDISEKVSNMSELLTRVINEADAKGRTEGKVEGENNMVRLVKILLSEDRMDDMEKAAEDADFRNQLYQEFQIA